MRIMDIISLIIGIIFTIIWWFTEKIWITNDILAICSIISIVKIFKFISLKNASYFLITTLLA